MFKLISDFQPKGDQPNAIEKLVDGLNKELKHQVLLGVTGSGKTFTMANIIQKIGLPTLIISPNKTLAAQLYEEFRGFFPENAVHYFVSYYDYYQPEAYLPATDTYISKDARINKDIDKLRHAALQAVLNRKDTIVVSSVSCIYGVGDPAEYQRISLELKIGQKMSIADVGRHLNFLRYERVENEPKFAGQFRMDKSEVLITLITGERFLLKFKNREVSSIINLFKNEKGKEINPVRNSPPIGPFGARERAGEISNGIKIFPAKFWVTPHDRLRVAMSNIKKELGERVEDLQSAGKFEEAERLEKRVSFDMERLKKDGYVNGIENYSRHLGFRKEGEPPMTILEYFPKPFLLFIDESHIGVPQLNGMYQGDRNRKQTLVDHGFRLPSAMDNRPLRFEEFKERIDRTIYVSATPGNYEMKVVEEQLALSGVEGVAEQIIRPTGVIDPEIIIRPAQTQIESLLAEIKKRTARNERVLALTLTKRQSEDLTEFLLSRGIKAQYLHSDIKTLDRPGILRQLRNGEVDVLVGINLLREGLDLPEVSLIAILNADREGFLRNHRSLMQMAGRAARSTSGQVIFYADQLTDSIRKAVGETSRRRKIQVAYNKKFGISPQTIIKPMTVASLLEIAGMQSSDKEEDIEV
ncbi:MAG TPA: excinuclease ABC subunit UvrB [Candidatus Paceibacterota bacterium]|nr:excinuclease ABC subunit UvrB [Candidatus Paceibacterota bacterium]